MPFPHVDPVGPDSAPLPDAAMALLARIADGAQAADRDGVPRATLDALARAGLLGRPLEPASQQRELAEVLAGCDATTWFCWTQHTSPTQALAVASTGPRSPNADDLRAAWLSGLQSGALVAGVAFAHVRRPGPPHPVATRIDGGWRIDGTLDWVTSWDIADVVLVVVQGGGDDAERFISFLLPAGHSGQPSPTGVQVGEPLALLAMSGTHTRPIRLDGVVIPDDQVVSVVDTGPWRAVDDQRTADAGPAAFGLTRAAVAELTEIAEQRHDEVMATLARDLAKECRTVRAEAYALADDPDRDGTRARRLQVRAHSLDLVTRAAMAVVTARAGAAMLQGCSAERRLRESMFLLVQAQTADTRRAQLEREIDSTTTP